MNYNKYIDFVKGNTATGIEINLYGDDTIRASIVLLKKNKYSIEKVKDVKNITSYDELFDNIDNRFPIYISMEGKGIIHKPIKLSTNNENNTESLAVKYFPNFTEKDFYIQRIDSSESTSHLSLARKELIDAVIEKFSIRNLFVFEIVLGPFALNSLSTFNNEISSIEFKNYQVILSNGIIQSFTKIEKEELSFHKIDSENISSEVLLPFACSLNHFIHDLHSQNFTIKFANNVNDFIYKKTTKLVGLAFISLLFFGLLLNFFAFSQYDSKLAEVKTSFEQLQTLDAEFIALQKEIKSKELFFSDKLLLETSKMSHYLDQISLKLPSSISLSEMSINPLEKTLNPNNEIVFTNKLIVINGVTSNTQDLNNWINFLKKLKWIKEVNLINLQQIENKDITNFIIEISRK